MDIDAWANPTIVADILEWDYKAFPRDSYDFVWASPLCTYYSKARTCRNTTEAEFDYADSLVKKTLAIII